MGSQGTPMAKVVPYRRDSEAYNYHCRSRQKDVRIPAGDSPQLPRRDLARSKAWQLAPPDSQGPRDC